MVTWTHKYGSFSANQILCFYCCLPEKKKLSLGAVLAVTGSNSDFAKQERGRRNENLEENQHYILTFVVTCVVVTVDDATSYGYVVIAAVVIATHVVIGLLPVCSALSVLLTLLSIFLVTVSVLMLIFILFFCCFCPVVGVFCRAVGVSFAYSQDPNLCATDTLESLELTERRNRK